MPEFWFHSFDIETTVENGKKQLLNSNYVKREGIDEEGFWRIESDSLMIILTTIDEQIQIFSNFTYMCPLVTFNEMPSYHDHGWEAIIEVASWGEL